MSTYLVTGGAGFIGSSLCDRLLAGGARVVAVDDLSAGRIANLAESRTYGQQFTFHHLDVRDEGLRTLFQHHRPEVVMHLAAQASVSASLEDPVRDASINVMGLLNVLEAAASAGVRKVAFAASGGTLYGQPRKIPAKETARWGAQPLSPYGVAKKVAEDYLRIYRQERSLDYVALALANVYGPRQDPFGEAGVVAIFSARMLAGETPTIFGDGEQTRDYVFVDDVVDAFARAADRGSGVLVNVGTGVETSVNRIFQLLAEVTGYRSEPHYGPARPGEVRRTALDAELAGAELGWKPWTALDKGLAATVAAVRGNREGVAGRSE